MDGITLIAKERHRQLAVEGWTAAHDDTHTDGSLAACASFLAAEGTDANVDWPDWEHSWIREVYQKHASGDRIRMLVVAGALIAAEIDRQQRSCIKKDWLILESRHQLWWRANAKGYTASLLEAGFYTKAEAESYACNPSRFDRAVHISEKRVEIEEAAKNVARLMEILND